jgi:1,2-diacylglycerol 3-alpha-glucosyltransferase
LKYWILFKYFKKIGCFIKSIKNIAIITPGFARDEADTVCIPALQVWVKALAKVNIQLTIFTIHYPFVKEEYDWHGIRIIPLNAANNPLKRKFIFPKLKKKFSAIHRVSKFDVIHSFWLNETTYFGQRLGNLFSIPHVATAMGQDVLTSNKWLRKIDFSMICSITVLSKFHELQWHKLFKHKVEVIPFGIHPLEIDPNSNTKSIDIIGVGNLIRLKQFDYIIDLAAILVKKRPNLSVILVGDGPEKGRLLNKIKELKLADNVQILGELSYEATMEKIGNSKLLIHPSNYESFGMIFIEAMNLETHVFAGSVGFAYENNRIENLTFDIERDVQKAISLLTIEKPKRVSIDISDSVSDFLKIYNRF